MTQEDKQLLLKDLCARLPYGVKVTDGLHTITLKVRTDTAPATLAQFMQSENLMYYLRPMSSMTDSEYKEYEEANDLDTLDSSETLKENLKTKSRVRISKWYHGVDWLNEHHFDYRGLIEKGLALEAPEDMYKTE